MRILITSDNGQPHGLGRHSIIVDDATQHLAQALEDARAATPDEVLSIPNARVHASAGEAGTASLRAGNIVEISAF